ncbi:MAG: hypothetical protein IKF72_09325 [Kiritimatiellae bacterium]|nr:hypothetical protein [Kiritimatiellia bacterium]
MRKNRKIPKNLSVVAANTMRFGAILVFGFVMVILNLLASSTCKHLMATKGKMEKELARLEDARMQESTRWEEMKTPDRIEIALLKHGLSMKLPRPDQNVRMRADGTPYPGQLSLARGRRRVGSASAALSKPAAPGARRRLR